MVQSDLQNLEKLYQALLESEQSNARLLSNLPGVAYRCHNDENWTMTFLSQGCFELTGYAPEELLRPGGITYYDLIDEEYVRPLFQKWRQDIDSFLTSTDEYPIRTADGKRKWVWEQSRGVCGDDGAIVASEGFITDITDKVLREEALKKSEERFRTIYEKSQIGIGIYDSVEETAIQVNDRLSEILGRTKEELAQMKWEHYSFAEDFEENRHQLNLIDQGSLESITAEKRFIRPDGSFIWANVIVTPFELEGHLNPCYLCMFQDVTAQKLAEEETEFLSFHDQLTGLYNRRFYDEELRRLDTERNLPISLIMADVNGLKLTNDAFGHFAGDHLLQTIGHIMRQECRAEDIVARIGGDEFILLLPRTSEAEAERIVRRIQGFVKKEKWDNLVCSVSFGTGTKKKFKEDMKKIYMLAEDRMYRDKLTESRSMRYETIRVIRETLYQKNVREQLHCERVSELCEAIGNQMNLSLNEVQELKTAGLLHDIGKIGIDEKLLNKEGQLSTAEWEEIKRHPEVGYHILSSLNEFASIAEYVLGHHERMDGTGYPRKLKAEAIPMQSKIISIADSYDAMTRDRTYKKKLTKEEAIEEIQRNMGTQFDEGIAKVFIEYLNNPLENYF